MWLWIMTGSAGQRPYLPPYPPVLEQRHLDDCRVVCHREELLRQLPIARDPAVAEIGVCRGEFSQLLLRHLNPRELHLFDLDLKPSDVARRAIEAMAAGRIRLHEGDSSTLMSRLPEKYFDLIYIDGDHSYTGVVKDIAASAPRVADGGYLVFNDYTFWSPCENLQYGVVQAVNEFCHRENWHATHFALDSYMYCDIALRRP